MRWEGVRFEFATWLGASGPKGYVDTQSAYLCQDGEPPVNVHVWHSKNVTFSSCDFQHLGAVYAIGAHNASQSIIVSNCTFTDCSGGAVKLGDVGERGAPSPGAATPPAQQDRGFLVSDNYIHDMPLVSRTPPTALAKRQDRSPLGWSCEDRSTLEPIRSSSASECGKCWLGL